MMHIVLVGLLRKKYRFQEIQLEREKVERGPPEYIVILSLNHLMTV